MFEIFKALGMIFQTFEKAGITFFIDIHSLYLANHF